MAKIGLLSACHYYILHSFAILGYPDILSFDIILYKFHCFKFLLFNETNSFTYFSWGLVCLFVWCSAEQVILVLPMNLIYKTLVLSERLKFYLLSTVLAVPCVPMIYIFSHET